MENFSTLGYMNIVFKNEANYLPPHQSGNSITNYPVRTVSSRPLNQNQIEKNQGQIYRGRDIQAHRNTANQSDQYQQIARPYMSPQLTYDFRSDQENPQVVFNQP